MVLEKCRISYALHFFLVIFNFVWRFGENAIEKYNCWEHGKKTNGRAILWSNCDVLKPSTTKNNNIKNNENEEQKSISRNLLFRNDPETAVQKKQPNTSKKRQRGGNSTFFQNHWKRYGLQAFVGTYPPSDLLGGRTLSLGLPLVHFSFFILFYSI